jgi:Na+/H+-translocating membrane pyrophosphatase
LLFTKYSVVHQAICTGAEAFLRSEYTYCLFFEAIFGIIIFALISWSQSLFLGLLTTVAFALGALTSILSGYIGMKGEQSSALLLY